MYNYSLMNNASRLLLIRHTRPRCSNCSRRDKHVHSYVHTHTHYIDRMSTQNDVTGVHMCVIF